MVRLIFDDLSGKRGDYHVATTSLRPFCRTMDHDHDFVEAFLVIRGEGAHRINGRVEMLRRGVLCWVDARDRHGFEASGGEAGGLEFMNIAWRSSWWRRVAGALGGDPFAAGLARRRRIESPQVVELEGLIQTLLGRGLTDQALSLEIAVRIVRILAEDSPGRDPGTGAAWLDALAADLGDPEKLGHPISWWVARTGRSREHVARVCRARLGAPLSELLNRSRLAWVKRSLGTGDRKIADIAMEAGFQNLGYFFRLFRAHEGMTPRHWRLAQIGSGVVPR
jgi:AraC-like DNA-binding protein